MFLDDLRAEFDAAESQEGQPPLGRTQAVSGEAGRYEIFRPGLRVRELPHHRLSRIARTGDGGDPRTARRRRRSANSTWPNFSRITVDQFYGIELGEFPARIAETALWMMDHIMNNRLSLEFGQTYTRIPLTTSPHVLCADALEPTGRSFSRPRIVLMFSAIRRSWAQNSRRPRSACRCAASPISAGAAERSTT